MNNQLTKIRIMQAANDCYKEYVAECRRRAIKAVEELKQAEIEMDQMNRELGVISDKYLRGIR